MDPNGNLNYAERRGLKPGEWVVYQTEALAHRGEMTGAVARVGESGIVYIGTHGARYALLSDFVRRADWAPGAQQPAEATPEPARRARAPKPGKDAPKAPDAPAGQEMRLSGVYGPTLGADTETGLMMAPAVAIEALRARVEALTRERNDLRCRLMSRPSLAPEHVASLRDMLNFCEQYTRDHPIPRAIRAALAALGEDV